MKDSSISGYSFIDPLTGQSLEYSMNLNSNMEMKIPQRTPKGTTEMNMSMLMKQNTSGKVISRTKTIEPAISISVARPGFHSEYHSVDRYKIKENQDGKMSVLR